MELIVVVVISAGIAENSLNGVIRSLIDAAVWHKTTFEHAL